MDDTRIDLTHLKGLEEDILVALIDTVAIMEGFEEHYIDSTFEGDDIIFQVYLEGVMICEVGSIDEETYVTIISDSLQYRGTLSSRINILDEFKNLCEECKNG